MDTEAGFQADLIVQSFVYVARQLAGPATHAATSAQYVQIHSAAEKHNSALSLVLRDAIQRADKGLRNQSLTKAERNLLCTTVAQTIAEAQKAIARTVAQYATHKLAA